MIVCPVCNKPTPPGSFCTQCGTQMPAPMGDPSATVMLSQTMVRNRTDWQHTLDLAKLFEGKTRLIIGRARDCDYRILHPSVSHYHAALERLADGGLLIRDIGSTNGVWIDNRRVAKEGRRVSDGDRVGIGPVVLQVTGGNLQGMDSSKGFRLEARSVEKLVLGYDGKPRKLLDGVSLVIDPGEFVCLLGPSGSGKSTLMDCLNGRRRATGGKVLANGLDFYRHFDSFRTTLGYVPQKDIVHSGLTVEDALWFTAKLRLPIDTSHDELLARTEHVIKQMELDKHRQTFIGNLSGGQIKRVSLGAELIAEPTLLYVDEATSGLDAGTEARMMKLFRALADEGKSLLCITHNVDNVDQCHFVVILAHGKLLFVGPPDDAPAFFGAKKITEIYDRIPSRELADWQSDFRQTDHYRRLIKERLEQAPPKPEEPPPIQLPGVLGEVLKDSKVVEHLRPLAEYFRGLDLKNLRRLNVTGPVREASNQFSVLLRRYVKLILADARGLRLLLLQAPVVALFILLGFVGKPFVDPMPLMRPINADERRALERSRALQNLLDDRVPLTEEQKTALAKIRVTAAGVPAVLDARSVVAVLRHVQGVEPNDEQRKVLEDTTFELRLEGRHERVSAAEMLSAYRQFREMKLSDKILELEGPIIPYGQGRNPRYTYMLLFIVAMVVLWFGCNNAAKEIVKEEAIYSRERSVNLRIAPYLAGKFLVMGLITVAQTAVLMLCIYGTLEALSAWLPGHTVPSTEHMLPYPTQFFVLSLLALNGVALGLLLSSCVSTPDRANALLPYVLIPQMILGGGIITVTTGLIWYLAMGFSPVYWAYFAIHQGANLLPLGYPGHEPHAPGFLVPCLALAGQTALLLGATWVFLKAKDA